MGQIVLSNRGMEHTQALERRIEELEIKASFAEDLLDQLNVTVFRQQEQLDRLVQQITQLRQQIPEGSSTRTLRDDLPPHY